MRCNGSPKCLLQHQRNPPQTHDHKTVNKRPRFPKSAATVNKHPLQQLLSFLKCTSVWCRCTQTSYHKQRARRHRHCKCTQTSDHQQRARRHRHTQTSDHQQRARRHRHRRHRHLAGRTGEALGQKC